MAGLPNPAARPSEYIGPVVALQRCLSSRPLDAASCVSADSIEMWLPKCGTALNHEALRCRLLFGLLVELDGRECFGDHEQSVSVEGDHKPGLRHEDQNQHCIKSVKDDTQNQGPRLPLFGEVPQRHKHPCRHECDDEADDAS